MRDRQDNASVRTRPEGLRSSVSYDQRASGGKISNRRTALAVSSVASLAPWLPIPSKSSQQQGPQFRNFRIQKPAKEKRNHLQTFCQKIPRTLEAWQEKRRNLRITTADDIRAFFYDIISPDGPSSSTTPADLDDVKKYITSKRRSPGKTDDQRDACLSTMQELVFFGECLVASVLGVEPADVHKATRQYYSDPSYEEWKARRYRRVAFVISKWMGQLYEDCSSAAFELFLHGMHLNLRPKESPLTSRLVGTLSSFENSVRSDENNKAFSRVVRPLIPTELCVKDASPHPPHLTFYLPFLVWASIFLNVKVDCFDEVRQAFLSVKFVHSDFVQWLLFLAEGRPGVLGLVQSAHDACSIAKPRTHDAVASSRTTTETFTESGASQGLNVEVGQHHTAVASVPHDGEQELPVLHDDIPLSSSQTAAFGHPIHFDASMLAINHGLYFPNDAQATGDVGTAVDCYGLGRPVEGSACTMDMGSLGAAALSSNSAGALGCGSAVDSAWSMTNIGSECIDGVELRIEL
ncbi:hypothetical protein CABS01_16711 [Colletotrichum abscissum]|uniref:uncharacterized protein n=1 Tax=Colletotrichum abscissum TaxID=1671311 RepID=UPI0027D5D092|nr:uncharacterized protein CABS01_16711 [Colletotrichum abscissum]KAK1515418.1 hypothetical protein CABS01_16711 [Colletotrichum abscissum]